MELESGMVKQTGKRKEEEKERRKEAYFDKCLSSKDSEMTNRFTLNTH